MRASHHEHSNGLPGGLLSPQHTDFANFHQSALLCGVWLLVIAVCIHTMAAMRAVLEPLLWAFFLMMGLLPLTDTVEWLLLRACLSQGVPWCMACPQYKTVTASDSGTAGETELEAGRHMSPASHHLVEPEQDDELISLDGCSDEGCNLRKPARVVAVLLVIGGFFALISLFFVMIYQNVAHMRDSWEDYQLGAKRISNDTQVVLSLISKQASPNMMHDITEKMLGAVGDVLSFLVSAMVGNLTSTMVSMLMILLYMVFWLCHPVYIQESVAVLFKRYILLKTLASAGYAFCVWVLLHALGINLAVVFGLITFLFNFVPEVGPFLAAMLPVPVILFDGRLSNPWLVLSIALGGTLMLKFLFGNIVEVILIESQQDMKMHPVIILFLMAFFGWIWGATGMVLSVPLMAAAKGSMYVLPPTYRNPLLMILEGDKRAPARYDAWYQNRHVVQEPVAQCMRSSDPENY